MTEEKQKKSFNVKDIKKHSIYVLLSGYFTMIMFALLLICINLLIGQLCFKFSNNILNFIVLFASFSSFFILKDGAGDNKKAGSIIFKIMLLICTLVLVNGLILGAISGITDKTIYKGISSVIYLVDFGLIIASIGLLTNKSLKETINMLCEESLLDKLGGGEVDEIQPGDAVLGYQVVDGKKTNIPVVLPLKDRFLHMLILGPTGCGKTSQSIIPMINRDMQDPKLGITVLEPKGDLAEKVYAMAKYYGREVVYFNPILPDCPYFNPLFGRESDVVENLATTFNMLNPDSPQFFKDMSENLIRKSTMLLKRLYGNDATLLDLNTLVWDANGQGRKMVAEFSRLKITNPEIARENEEIYSWFLNDYYSGMGGSKGSKTYEHCSGVRSQIAKLTSNKYLRKVLNPPKGHGSDLDFDDAFERGIVVTMGTAQGSLRDLGRYLGYFIILQLQASVFRRPGNEFTRTHNMLYIDEFQVYSNPGFADMLTMGRSYRVASHLATQARAQMAMGGGSDGKNFVELVSTNARNKIIYPGVSAVDAKYYSEEFGEVMQVTESKTYAKQRFFSNLTDERVSTAIKEELTARFTETDIIYRPFGQISYCIIKKNSIQAPGISQIEYIPKELNDLLDKMVAEYNEEQLAKAENPDEIDEMKAKNLDENNDFSAKADINKSYAVRDINSARPNDTVNLKDIKPIDPISTMEESIPSYDIDEDVPVEMDELPSIEDFNEAKTINNKIDGDNSFDIPMEDMQDDLM